jgi:hypothetical protein
MQEDLAKFGYINWREKKRPKRRFGLNTTISTCFSTKHGNFWGVLFFKKTFVQVTSLFFLIAQWRIFTTKNKKNLD